LDVVARAGVGGREKADRLGDKSGSRSRGAGELDLNIGAGRVNVERLDGDISDGNCNRTAGRKHSVIQRVGLTGSYVYLAVWTPFGSEVSAKDDPFVTHPTKFLEPGRIFSLAAKHGFVQSHRRTICDCVLDVE